MVFMVGVALGVIIGGLAVGYFAGARMPCPCEAEAPYKLEALEQ